ncbi:shikimate kinase [Jannaschia sp. 2305UL9-9]|uniref:shikimate kinase n=1 Tax=Jannaschia sp. 2305UL9-9 TaxID=3121638 RepID=UPI00352974E3
MGDKTPETTRLTRPVVLVGMMGSGKTAVGTALAQYLGVPFRDTDEALVDAARMTIPEIFERDGEAFFRAREAEVLRRLLTLPPGIVSTGGGAFLRAENRDAIAEAGISVWLRAAEPLLWARVRNKTTRPLLRTENPRATLGQLLAEREPAYAKATLVVDADPAFSIDDMVMRVADTLRNAGILEGPHG